MTLEELKTYIRDIPDFPKPGIVFKDITPLLAAAAAFQETVNRIADHYRDRVDMVLGIESRGFIVGAAVAYRLGLGLALVRKPGKLPAERYAASYALEYGTDTLEIHRDAFGNRTRVLIVDDLLATGGTASAAIELVRRLDGVVGGCAFIIELAFLQGRRRLDTAEVFALLRYDAE
jgi:adenine phosphoribosyltransferase